MPSSNGIAPDELEEALDTRLRQDAAAGFALPGVDPYADDWDLDLALPECPDRAFREGDRIDATLLLARVPKRTGRMREAKFKRQRFTSMDDIRALREGLESKDQRLAEAWGPYNDPFAYGQGVGGMTGLGVLGEYIPLMPGPATRQLYWQDYFAMSAKAFEAYNHDPISWRCVHMKQEFALGKGLQAKVTFSSGAKAGQSYDAAQVVWDEFWTRNRMDERLDLFARDISVMGEQFIRYFGAGRGKLAIRSLDPASIYDLITDQEDIETVYGYHQQFQTPYQMWSPSQAGTLQSPTGPPPTGPTDPGATTRYIIRQIPAGEIDHYKINAGAFERRGRSDLFPALGWIKRLRDYLTSHVIRADLTSRICWDLEVNGNQAAISQLRSLLFPRGQAPPPGTVFGHNSASKLNSVAPQTSAPAGRFDPILDALVTMVADSIGLPKDWLGFVQGSTRATALVATEPAARSLEELQGKVETVLHDVFNRVMRSAGISDAEAEFTFPSIASEDRTQKLQDLSYAEANGWLSKQTAAAIAAKELGITSYDFEEEQGLIAEEFPEPEMEDIPDGTPDPVTGKLPQRPKQGDGKPRRSVIVASNRQAAKLDITKSPTQEDEPPGLLVPTDGSTAPAPGDGPPAPPANGDGPPAPKSRAGFPVDENPMSGTGATNIRKDGKVGEAEVMFTPDQVQWLLMRERERRRRPDDPDFERASAGYRRTTAENLAELVRDAN